MTAVLQSKYLLFFKTILFLLAIQFVGKTCLAQEGMWTWVSGTDSTFAHGVYGTKGVPNSANHPPALYEPAHWVDLDGNFWIYGGLTEPDPGGGALCNALWRYKPS